MPARPVELYLHEEVLLLALRDEKGTAVQGFGPPMGGAILAELLMAQRISVTEDKKKLVNLLADHPFGDPVIDECLRRIKDARRRASLQTWVTRFAGLKNLKHRVAEGLCRQGILRADEDKILLLFTRKVYPERDPQPERRIVDRLHRAIFSETNAVDPRTIILLSLAHGADLLKFTFDKKQLKERKKRIESITRGEVLGPATREALQAAQTAAMMVAIIPAVVVTTASH